MRGEGGGASCKAGCAECVTKLSELLQSESEEIVLNLSKFLLGRGEGRGVGSVASVTCSGTTLLGLRN